MPLNSATKKSTDNAMAQRPMISSVFCLRLVAFDTNIPPFPIFGYCSTVLKIRQVLFSKGKAEAVASACKMSIIRPILFLPALLPVRFLAEAASPCVCGH